MVLMKRRIFLTSIGTVGIAAIAGCSGSDDNTSSSSGGASTETEAPNTETEAPNTETEENDAEARTHEVGETFTVGEGDRVIQYTIDAMTGVDSLGNDYLTEEADGQFAVVEMTIENKAEESFNISSNKFAIVAGPEGEESSLYEPSDDVTAAYDSDERFDTESILYEQLNPNLPTEGAVIFDIPKDVTLAFRIEPAGFLDTSEPHYVLPPK